jgi:hypothetical protein
MSEHEKEAEEIPMSVCLLLAENTDATAVSSAAMRGIADTLDKTNGRETKSREAVPTEEFMEHLTEALDEIMERVLSAKPDKPDDDAPPPVTH